MKISLILSESQKKYLDDHSNFNLQDWFDTALNQKINELKVRGEKISVVIAAAGRNPCIIGEEQEIPNRYSIPLRGIGNTEEDRSERKNQVEKIRHQKKTLLSHCSH